MIDKNLPWRLLLLFALVARPAIAEFDADRFAGIVESGMAMWHVPGMAVSVIDDGHVVFQRGFGVTGIDGGTAIDEHTLFANASTTKAMIAAGLLMLADDGKLSLDDRVIDHVPELHFGDPALTQQISLRDLLAHRTGLPSTDLWTFMQRMPLDEQLQRLRLVEPESPPRTRLIYQNTMYEIAGLIIERVTGKPWADFLTERLWRPIGMLATFGARGAIPDGKSHVLPHDFLDGEVRVVDWDFPPDLFDAAGSAWTTIADMTRWAQFLLRGGITENGERLVSEVAMHAMFEPHQLATPEDFYPTVELTKPTWRTYALGWFQQDFGGRAIDFHTGSLSGLIAIIGLDRKMNKAVVVLGNRDHAELRHALLWEVMDTSEDATRRDWNREIFDLYRAAQEEAAAAWAENVSSRLANTRPALPLDAYAGTYSDAVNGNIRILRSGETLVLVLPSGDIRMTHWHRDTFLVKHADWQYGDLAVFNFGADGNIEAFELFGIPFELVDEAN